MLMDHLLFLERAVLERGGSKYRFLIEDGCAVAFNGGLKSWYIILIN